MPTDADSRIEFVQFYIDRYKADFGVNLAIVAFFVLFFRIDEDLSWSTWKTAGAISVSSAAYALIVMGVVRSELLDTLELLYQEKGLGQDVGYPSGVGPESGFAHWVLYPFTLIGNLVFYLPIRIVIGIGSAPLRADESLPRVLSPVYSRVAVATLVAGTSGIIFFVGFLRAKYG